MKHLAQSLHTLLVEGSMNGARVMGTPSKRLLEALLVELMDGIACRSRIAAEVTGNLVSVLATVACEQDLLKQRKVKVLKASAIPPPRVCVQVTQWTHLDRSFHRVEDNH
jgi:hypothetical protein